MPPSEADVYDYLKSTKVSEVTTAQLQDSIEQTFIEHPNVEMWRGPITIRHAVSASRCYPHGLAVPESGSVSAQPCPAEQAVTFQPAGTEIWSVEGIDVIAGAGTPTVSVSLTDGATDVLMHRGASSTTSASFFPWESPLTITNTLYLKIANADASNDITCGVAFLKVGL